MTDFNNKEIAVMLSELADLLEISGENPFRVRAYANAARKIMESSEDLKKLAAEDRLEDIKGIGKGIAATIKDTFINGYCPPLEEIKGELPTGVLELIKLPGLGPKRAHQLFYQLGIQDLEDFKKALKEGEVKELKGFGPKTEKKLLDSLERYQSYQKVYLLHHATLKAEEIVEYLRKSDKIDLVEKTGSIRRRKELIGNIDILAASNKNEEAVEYFTAYPFIKEVHVEGKDKTSAIIEGNIQVDFRVVSKGEFPVALQYFTGSREHNDRLRKWAGNMGYSFNEYDLFKGDKRVSIDGEADLYRTLGLDYIIPELREDRGEIEAAASGRLPASIKLKDIKGDLHMHSRFSDGAYSIEEMARTASKLGYQYIAITDHSQSLKVAQGMTPETLIQQMEEIDRIQEFFQDIRILKGVEVDINSDGSLDYNNELLEKLDLVIASIHTGFNQSEEQITSRIIKAMENPCVNIIGHPQGRILKRRKPYMVDMEKVIQAAAETGTCLEINSSPYRLDLDDLMVKRAKEAGVKVAINTDAHHKNEFADIQLGVAVARRGWLTGNDVLNTMEIDELMDFLS